MTAELKASRDDRTLILSLHHPGQGNALNSDTSAAFIETLSKVERDDAVRNVIITGADGDFCAGIQSGKDPASLAATLEALHQLIETLRSFPKPVIAAVEGRAIDGGFSLALACDLIVATPSASFGISPAQIGSWGTGGSAWLLSQKIPAQWLTEIFLDAKPISASRLHSAGLINQLVADGSALTQALSWAGQLANTPADAFEQLKALLNNAASTTLSQHLAWEKQFLLTRHHGQI